MDNRIISEKFAKIGADLIKKEPSLLNIKNSQATIVYLTSELKKKNKDKYVCAECEKVPEKYKWSIPADYTITVFLPNIEGFTEKQEKILIFHELLHINITCSREESESYELRNHDYDDFKEIIDRFGTDWNKIQGEIEKI